MEMKLFLYSYVLPYILVDSQFICSSWKERNVLPTKITKRVYSGLYQNCLNRNVIIILPQVIL